MYPTIEKNWNKIQIMFSAWVTQTKNWDGKDTLFYIKIWMTRWTSSKYYNGDLVKAKSINEYEWEPRQFSVLMPPILLDILSGILAIIPDNLDGFRYITDISLDVYYPHLKELKAVDNLRSMVSSFDDYSFNSDSNSCTWKI